MKFGLALKQYRFANHITVKELADEFATTKQVIRDIEMDRTYDTDFVLLQKIMDRVNVWNNQPPVLPQNSPSNLKPAPNISDYENRLLEAKSSNREPYFIEIRDKFLRTRKLNEYLKPDGD